MFWQFILLLLLLLLCSQLYLWGSPLLVRFFSMWPFFNPTIEVFTCHLCGWCMLGVFVAGIHPSRTWMSGSFECIRWNACVHRLDLGLYSHPNEFWGNGVRTHVNSKGKISSTGGSEEVQTCSAASCRTASQTHYRLSYSSPLAVQLTWTSISFCFSRFYFREISCSLVIAEKYLPILKLWFSLDFLCVPAFSILHTFVSVSVILAFIWEYTGIRKPRL